MQKLLTFRKLSKLVSQLNNSPCQELASKPIPSSLSISTPKPISTSASIAKNPSTIHLPASPSPAAKFNPSSRAEGSKQEER